MVSISTQFNGPSTTANGGFACGTVAAEHLTQHADGPVAVRLHQPPPLATPLTWQHTDTGTELLTAGGALIANSSAGSFIGDPPAAASSEEAIKGESTYKGYDIHPFDTCFTCGTARTPGDGLRIFSGQTGDGRTAARWLVQEEFDSGDGTVDAPITWAAIDCAGGWTGDFTVNPALLGTMTGQIFRAPEVGKTYHVVGELLQREGKKLITRTALHTPEGELMARSEQVWIVIDPNAYSG